MKLYCTTSTFEDTAGRPADHREYTSSKDEASKARTRRTKEGHTAIETKEVEVPTTRSELIEFLNGLSA